MNPEVMTSGSAVPTRGSDDTRDENGLLKEFRTAVCSDLRVLATLHDAEPGADLVHGLKASLFPGTLGMRLVSPRGGQAMQLMDVALREMPDPLPAQVLDDLAVDYADIYLVNAFQAAPSESVWIDDENITCQQPMFQVRECYRRHGLAVADWRIRPDDHLVTQLQFMAHLFDPQSSGDTLTEVAQFMDEHLLRWLTPFSERIAARCATPYFAGAAMLTAAYCEELREILAQILDVPRPGRKEIDLRMRPKRDVIPAVPVKFMPGLGPGW